MIFQVGTLIQYKTSVQKEMINQNRGLVNACSSINNFAEDEEELVKYIKAKIEDVNQGEAQEVSFK